MKKSLVGLLILGSISSFANCKYSIEDTDMRGCAMIKNSKIIKIVKKSLEIKGYLLVEDETEADLSLLAGFTCIDGDFGGISTPSEFNMTFTKFSTMEKLEYYVEVVGIPFLIDKRSLKKTLATVPVCNISVIVYH